MANCPNCGSDHIELRQDRQVNWGGAMIGYIAFGAIGSAVGATSGAAKATNYCMDCGTAWQAADVFKILQAIKEQFAYQIDLGRQQDRDFMNRFLNELVPQITELEKEKSAIKTQASEFKAKERSFLTFNGFWIGLLFGIFLVFIVQPSLNLSTNLNTQLALLALISPIVGFLRDIHVSFYSNSKKWISLRQARIEQSRLMQSRTGIALTKIDRQIERLVEKFKVDYESEV